MVVSVGNVSKSPFDELRYGKSYTNYYYYNRSETTKNNKNTEIQNKEENTTPALTPDSADVKAYSNIDQEIIDTVVNPKKDKKQKVRAGLIVGGSAVALGGITFALTRGKVVKFGSKLINSLSEKMTSAIERLETKESLSGIEKFYYTSLQKLNKHAKKARGSVLNFTPIKDSLFSKLVKGKLKLGKLCDGITNGFRKLSFGTVKSNYRRTGKRLNKMADAFAEVNSRILSGQYGQTSATRQDVVQAIESRTNDVLTTFHSNFTEIPLKKRSDTIVKKLDGLDNKVYNSIYGNLKGFFKEKSWSTFIPEELIKEDKQQFLSGIRSKKKLITNTPQDNFKDLQEILGELTQIIDPKNNDSVYTLRFLKHLAKDYAKASGVGEAAARQEIITKINGLISDSQKSIGEHPYPKATAEKINELLNRFGTIVNGDKKGAIEDILTLYKEILPPEEYQRIKKIAQKAAKSVDKSVRQEGSDYVDKLRDLAVGSALTDIGFGVAIPLATSAVAMSKADTKEKKRSVALKYAIPMFVGIGTCMTCTMKLIAGGKALFAAAVSSIAANQIGEFIDNKLLRKGNTNQEEQDGNKEKSTVTLAS